MRIFRRSRRARDDAGARPNERIDELVEEAREDNPDETTRREAYELELMEEERSREGAQVEVDEPDER
ncbi:MAG TPA: hypothetical protein VFC33_07510 [Acidimicrobiia bacterium]|nr:hypothetical protein [Acidimicrobiia bacterium]